MCVRLSLPLSLALAYAAAAGTVVRAVPLLRTALRPAPNCDSFANTQTTLPQRRACSPFYLLSPSVGLRFNTAEKLRSSGLDNTRESVSDYSRHPCRGVGRQ